MNENLTEVVVILDKSGSMAAVENDARGGFNRFLEDQQRALGEVQLTLVLFDTSYDLRYEATPIARVEPLTRKTYVPGGSTALWDAVGWTIDRVGERLAARAEAERPARVIVAILTDGEENSSQTEGEASVRARITHQTEVYNWDFIYLATGLDEFVGRQQGLGLGIRAAAVFSTSQANPAGAYDTLSTYAGARTQGRMPEQARREAAQTWQENYGDKEKE